MGKNRYYKKHIEKLIDADPSLIVLKRIVSEDDGFKGKKESEIELAKQKMRLYNKKSQREVVSDSGKTVSYMSSSVEKILATFETDIKEKDTFTHKGRQYRVTFVNEYFDICKQVEVEVINVED